MKLILSVMILSWSSPGMAQQSIKLQKGESLDISCPAGTQISVANPSRSRSLILCARVCTVEIAEGGSGYVIYVNLQNSQGNVQASSTGGWSSAVREARKYYRETSQNAWCDQVRTIGWSPQE